ncbi:MAG: GNAT family N-acetyltransferase [Cytophagaceae bacterium]|nr:GNAT family N-acetyltransferase [Cytophagaceae bacterium]|tara:strand:+ start:39210 stop:39653 length:444 start_codon:yes stop_codon:yes gene_type:complete
MKFIVKTYDELTKDALYDLLQLRAEVFVVEQDCPYQDVDGKDKKALHVLAYAKGELAAYTRIFAPGDYFERASIGRVVVKQAQRKNKFGYSLMNKSIEVINNHYGNVEIEISAQEYLKKFYTSLGFDQVGEGYLEDNIPHIRMIKRA